MIQTNMTIRSYCAMVRFARSRRDVVCLSRSRASFFEWASAWKTLLTLTVNFTWAKLVLLANEPLDAKIKRFGGWLQIDHAKHRSTSRQMICCLILRQIRWLMNETWLDPNLYSCMMMVWKLDLSTSDVTLCDEYAIAEDVESTERQRTHTKDLC